MADQPLALSSILIGGPCKITDGATVFYTESDVRLEPQPTWRAVPSSLGGDLDSVLVDLVWKVTFTPKSLYSYNSVLCPTAYTNWTVSGSRLIGAADRAVTILGTDGQQYALTRAVLTRMPDVYLGLGRSMWGQAEYTAFIGYTQTLAAATAFWTSTTGVAWAQTDFAAIAAAHQESMFWANWTAMGFTAMYAEEGFAITHEFRTTPVKQGNVTVDERIESYRAMVGFKPQQPTEAQLLGASQFGAGAGLGIGTRMTSGALANAHDLVLKDMTNTQTVTVKSAALERGQFIFDNKLTRVGEWAFRTALTTPGSRITFA